MSKFIHALILTASVLALAAAVVNECDACPHAVRQVQQIQGFDPCASSYSAPQAFFAPAPPPPVSYWMAPPVQQFVAPQRAYVQQEVLGFAPQPVAAVNVAYAQRAQVVGYANTAAVVGAPVALRGRFAGSPAVGNVQQLNLSVGKSRERVLRPTLFKRAVASPVIGSAAVVVPY